MRLLTILAGCAALTATLLSGASAPSFRDRIDYGTSIGVSAAVGDLNGDGIPDVLTCGGSAQAQIGNGDGTFTAGPVYSSGGIDCGVPLLADLNGDGNLDLVMTYYRDNTSGVAGPRSSEYSDRPWLPR